MENEAVTNPLSGWTSCPVRNTERKTNIFFLIQENFIVKKKVEKISAPI